MGVGGLITDDLPERAHPATASSFVAKEEESVFLLIFTCDLKYSTIEIELFPFSGGENEQVH